ncbi:MAG: hypothetical protein S4CHLAM81_07670 [Chlamydiales bacterium]|nr:hypothetical protein [Chlamydiales bacterium]MCH9635549.1 hypothetical protein [Chlamydiales bacterium]MCH9703902.1 1-acyl-sn-glycerol-3-phosphate acyltransferase [Chlamydiota bacterium]
MLFPDKLRQDLEQGQIPQMAYDLFKVMYDSYAKTIQQQGMDVTEHQEVFFTYLKLLKEQLAEPYKFDSYHQKEDGYSQFGNALFYHVLDRSKSKIFHKENLDKMEQQLAAGENVVFLANHQTEVDPQMLYWMLEKSHPRIANETIFIAGDRVVTDPAAVPISRGTNLLCIYSKRHMDNPPELKQEKLQQNQRTMKRMRELLAEGGKVIYVAPSGGRDRKNSEGVVEVAPFDPASIEMFRLQANKAKTKTHFYPFAMSTHDVLPPPLVVKSELGEARCPCFSPVYFAFGDEVDLDNFPGSEVEDRREKRQARANYIWNLVNDYYSEFPL